MKKQVLLFHIILMISHGLFASSQQSPHTFLFCLKPELQPLTISLNRGKPSVGMAELDDYFQTHGVIRIERWIKSATEIDRDGDIYLNRIYRVYLDDNRVGSIDESISSIKDFPFILSAEPEYLRKPHYTPNDPKYSYQCSLEAVKSDLAWDFWDIDNGDLPGDENILLASVDTGVDYTHPDLIDNIWVNQGELIENTEVIALSEIIDSNTDGNYSATEIDQFMSSQGSSGDLNNDGISNLRDALLEGSPFIDNIDNDGNGHIDDIIGWDASGISGIADNDPFPKDGVQNDSEWAHGTHIAGILAAKTDNGLGMSSTMFNGKILSVKCSRDASIEIPINDGYDGITYAAKASCPDPQKECQTRTIINCSWGGDGLTDYEQSVINIAFNTYGAIVVAAAGNGNGNDEEYAEHYPASYDNVVSVCAMSCNGNWGGWATYHTTVDLAAPGDNIYSTIIGGSYQTWDGSSMASPNASSVIGLVWSYYPERSNQDIIDQVKFSADTSIYEINPAYKECNGNAGQYCLGAGMVDAHKAIGQEFSPYIQSGPFIFTEISGDHDGIINPGETGYLTILLKNVSGWADSENIKSVLSSENSGVTIFSGYAVYGNIGNGDSLYNMDDVYTIELSPNIELGDIDLHLDISGFSGDYQYDQSLLYEKISVSLNQAGFPIPTAELRSCPLVIDLDGDGDKEIIIGDKGFSIHIYNRDGTEVTDHPFPFNTGNQIWGSASAADMDNDGLIDFVITSKSMELYIFDKNGLKIHYPTNTFLIGTPAIGNLDDDHYLEVVVSGYSSSNQLFVINHDGSDVDGFPLALNAKTKAGVALSDFDGNGLDDIVLGTDNNEVYLIYDNANVAPGFPFQVGDKIQTSPSVLDINGDKVIFVGSGEDSGQGQDNKFYAINADGTLRFIVETSKDIMTSPSFLHYNGKQYIFFGANDSLIYAMDTDGITLIGWPIKVKGKIVGSIVFSDLNGDGIPEVIAADDANEVIALYLNGSSYPHFPISNNETSFSGSPMVTDLDDDGDLEILIGSIANLVIIDVKETGKSDGYWSEFRGGYERRGEYNTYGGCTDKNYCNYDDDADWNDGSCSIKSSECSDGKLGCDCNGVCNGTAIVDCAEECNGDAKVDQCGECGGVGPDEGYDCDGNLLSNNKELMPNIYSIVNIYPNPFNPLTHIRYSLPKHTKVKIRVYNILGKQIEDLVNNFQSPGYHSISWDGSSYSSGVYFVAMEAGDFREFRKILLIK